jgi:putative transferase (TIGR04331 family)
MPSYLATTAISDIWDTSKKLVLLGPWCIADKNNRRLLGNVTYSMASSPWKPAIKIKEASDFCDVIYETFLPELDQQLNLMHGVSYDNRYWRVLIGPWLLHFIEVLYERYIRVENVFELFPDMSTAILPQAYCDLSVMDTRDFVSIRGKATQDYYNLKLFSVIINYLYPDKAVEKIIDVPLTAPETFSGAGLTKKLFYKAKNIKDAFSHPDIILSDMYHFDWQQILFLEFTAGPNSIIFRNFDPVREVSPNAYSKEKRAGLDFKGGQDKFQVLLRRLIPEAIPMCYVENFELYKKRVKKEKVKAVGSAIGWYFNEDFKFFAAESTLCGAKLLDFQHGGGYGTSLVFPMEAISLEKDFFYTWGWRSENSKKTIPLANQNLSKLKDAHRGKAERILFVGNAAHKYPCRFFSIFTADDMPQYFLDKKRFFDNLGSSVQRNMLYRQYHEVGWDEVDIVKEMMPELKIAPTGRLTDLLCKSSMVVVDNLGTTNLEALVVNVPTIWFWDFTVTLVRPEVERDFAMLMKAGMLYASPEEAAKKVNNVHEDPLKWWRSPEVQKARNAFCEKFAKTSIDWRKEWIEEFNRIPSK